MMTLLTTNTILKISFFFSIITLLTVVTSHSVSAAGNAKLVLSPSSASKSVGSTFDIDIRVDSVGDKINSVQAYVSFPGELMDVSISTVGSFANFFSQREVDQVGGMVKLNGGIREGIAGDNLLLATITVKVKKTGSALVSFSNQSYVYKGSTDILGTANTSASYTFTPSTGTIPAATSSARSATQSSQATSGALPNSGETDFSLYLITLSLFAIMLGFYLSKVLHVSH